MKYEFLSQPVSCYPGERFNPTGNIPGVRLLMRFGKRRVPEYFYWNTSRGISRSGYTLTLITTFLHYYQKQ